MISNSAFLHKREIFFHHLTSTLSLNYQIVEYIYSANGQKLAKKSPASLKTYCAGNFIYEETKEGTKVVTRLKYVLHPEGVVEMPSAKYQFHLKDHLGNTRVVVNSDNTTQQITNYYAFGLTSESYKGGLDNNYLYNGKEIQEDLIAGRKLDWYDFGARMYDPAIGRWHTVDPMIEWRYSFSPYDYCRNNPINRIDPDGKYDLAEITVRPSWWERFRNRIKNVFKSGSGETQNGGYTFVTSFGSIDPTRTKAVHNYGTINIDLLLLPISKVNPGSLQPAGSLRPAETISDIKDIIAEAKEMMNDIKDGKTDENVKENKETKLIIKE